MLIADAADAERASETYAGYTKLVGWLTVVRLGLPTLRGVVVTSWSPEAERIIGQFLELITRDAVTIRSDSLHGRGSYPPGGDLVTANELSSVVGRFLDLGRVVFLLEPRSRFDDLYSLSIGYIDASTVIVEAVGPGFDASDLNRGEASPHEWWRLDETDGIVVEHSRASRAAYEESWRTRLDKVARLVCIEQGIRPSNRQGRRQAEHWLRENGHNLLIDSETEYQAMPGPLLNAALANCSSLRTKLPEIGLQADSFVVSMTYFGRFAEPIYWDVAWPRKMPSAARTYTVDHS
jgi:hypothetical protein